MGMASGQKLIPAPTDNRATTKQCGRSGATKPAATSHARVELVRDRAGMRLNWMGCVALDWGGLQWGGSELWVGRGQG